MGWALLALGVALCCAPRPAWAQAGPSMGRSADRMVVAMDPTGFVGLTGTATPGHLRWELALATGYLHRPLPDAADVLLRRRASVDLEGELGLGSRAAITLGLPGVWAQDSEIAGPQAPDEAALGDPRLAARYRLLGELGTGGQAPDGPGLALRTLVTLPFGGQDALAGDGHVSTEFGATADFQLLGAGAAVDLGWLHRDRLGEAMTFAGALRVPMPFYTPLAVALEARGQTDFQGAASTPVELDLALRLQLGAWGVMLAGGVGLTDGYGVPDARGVLGLRYRPQPDDRDGDGVPDARDECPLLAEDHDGYQDADGCEDPDNDNDWVPDVDDLCPNVEAIEGRDADEDGCTDP